MPALPKCFCASCKNKRNRELAYYYERKNLPVPERLLDRFKVTRPCYCIFCKQRAVRNFRRNHNLPKLVKKDILEEKMLKSLKKDGFR